MDFGHEIRETQLALACGITIVRIVLKIGVLHYVWIFCAKVWR